MHLHFIFPRWQKLLEDHPFLKETLSGYQVGDFRMAGLGVATAAGAVPEEVEITLVDENVSGIDYSVRPDAVCIGYFTPQATNANRIADRFRAAGVKVIAGGIHPTMVPDDALAHADTIVEGPVEGLWKTILDDLAGRRLRRRYHGSATAAFATPRLDLFRGSHYLKSGVIQTARGCAVDCGFCVVPSCYGKDYTLRPVEDVLEEIRRLRFPCFFFADENFLFSDTRNREYRRTLLAEMIARRERRVSFTAAYPRFLKALQEEDMRLLGQARMRQVYLVTGQMEPLKTGLPDPQLVECVQRLKANGVEVLASFTLGNDLDDEPVEPLIKEFCIQTESNLAEFIIYTPFPGTKVFHSYRAAGRILTEDWDHYNGANVVFRPLHETPESLQRRYISLWKWFYSDINQAEIRRRYVRGFGGEIIR